MQRARHVGAQDEQFGDAPGIDRVVIDAAIGAEGADRAQQRAPLVIIDIAADLLGLGQQHMIFDVEDARGVVGALDEGAEPDEAEGVVMQHGAEHHAAEQMRALLHPIEEIAIAPAREPGEVEILHLQPGRVEALPGFAGNGRALGAGILARELDQRPDRGGIGRLERHIAHDRFMRQLAVKLAEAAVARRDGEDRLEMQRLLVEWSRAAAPCGS